MSTSTAGHPAARPQEPTRRGHVPGEAGIWVLNVDDVLVVGIAAMFLFV